MLRAAGSFTGRGFRRNAPEIEREVWATFVEEAAPGVLTVSDRTLLELACVLRALVSQRAADGKDRALLRSCIIEVGMTPASRSRVTAAPDKEQPRNEFAEI